MWFYWAELQYAASRLLRVEFFNSLTDENVEKERCARKESDRKREKVARAAGESDSSSKDRLEVIDEKNRWCPIGVTGMHSMCTSLCPSPDLITIGTRTWPWSSCSSVFDDVLFSAVSLSFDKPITFRANRVISVGPRRPYYERPEVIHWSVLYLLIDHIIGRSNVSLRVFAK